MQPPPLLRRRTVSELLDDAFRLYRRNLSQMLIISALTIVPLAILQSLLLPLREFTTLGESVLSALVLPLVGGALISAGVSFFWGQPVSTGAAYAAARSRWLSLVGATFLQGLIIGLPAAAIAVCAFTFIFIQGASDVATFVGIGGLLLLLLPFALYIAARYSVSLTAIMLEQCGAVDGLRRSWGLTRGQLRYTLGVLLTSGLLAFLISGMPSLLLIYLASLVGFAGDEWRIGFLGILLNQAGALIALPFSYLVTILLYFDLRVRSEALDLEMRI